MRLRPVTLGSGTSALNRSSGPQLRIISNEAQMEFIELYLWRYRKFIIELSGVSIRSVRNSIVFAFTRADQGVRVIP